MSEDNRSRLKQWLQSGEARLHPLAFPQRELWEASPVAVGDVANHICAFINVRGPIVIKDCEIAVQRVVERHEVLRSSFLPGKAGPLQMVRSSGTANSRYRELSASEAQPEALEEVMGEIFAQPFDMVRGPLYRVEMLQRGPDDLVMALAIHHAIADGWTLGVFVQDLVTAYIQSKHKQGTALPPVPCSYSDWAAAERAYWQPQLLAERAAFWKDRLSGSRPLWDSPLEAGPLQRRVTAVPETLTAAVRELARSTSTTLFSTLLTAFQRTLSKWTGKEDITVGTPVANRHKPTTRETMGYFAGNVPLRTQVDHRQPFALAVRQGHEATMDAFANAMPFAELTQALGDAPAPGHHPVYSVRFALQNHPVPDVTLPGLSLQLRMRSTGTARFDLGCEVTEDGTGLEVVWLYRRCLFDQSDIETLNHLFGTVLSEACGSPIVGAVALSI
ncbi:MAG: HxxPF-repeated protein [Verrucomicrobiaceae bacterium]|nr:HxxPF-repeated protein [Verrucomicrobiaceae bacterium]